MSYFILIILALLLDAIFGEPKWLWSRVPHPVQIMGSAISALDERANSGNGRRFKGAFGFVALLAGFTSIGYGIAALPDYDVLEVLGAAILIGHKSLVQHVAAVATALEQDIVAGRKAVSMIVGRETKNIDEPAVTRAAIESAAENFSDGVVAPVFWFALFGLPGIVAYKFVNTADSMIGHRNEKYEEFGWAAARLDDVMNYIPARITSGLIIFATASKAALEVVRSDSGQHRSPNAGWPESAMAGAMGVSLSGPRVYGGVQTKDPYVNAAGRKDLGPDDIRRSVRILWKSWAGLLGLLFVIWLLV